MTMSSYHEPTVAKKTGFSARSLPSWSITLISVSTLLVIWELCSPWINPLFGSYPSQIFRSFIVMMQNGTLVKAFVQSIQPFLVGYGLAALLGIPIGLLLGRYRVLDAAFGIYVTAGYATPMIALVPLLMVWFGLGFAVKVVIIFLLAFFPVCINTCAGVKAVPKTLIEVGTAFCASQSKIMRQIVLPATLPYIMAGLRLAVGKAVIAMIIAEFLTALSGLGGIIIHAANSFRTAEMFVPILLVMVLAIVLEKLLALLERIVAPWQREIAAGGH
ncbi:ABC transporter permease [Paracoccus sp. PS-1]|uniref:ABC transporter permease n=1 Tax=unclassified Paracoccus (in: a-proteobacteria) TaxID=2688777 RepID=UPI0004B4F898|nr:MULTISPECIES: ABC transporter permease [unclassified Paracoccus (in: a-proteobacteria)]MDQ7261365.1 ABC transporter permease [Paracoccus sp. PS1]